MSQIRETNKLRIEDFREQSKWISPIFETYNQLLSQLVTILNKGIIFTDNIVGINHTFEFTYQSESISFPQVVAWNSSLSPKNVYLTYAEENGDPFVGLISWRMNDARQIELKQVYKITTTPAISTLTAGARYKIRIKAEP